MVKCVVSRYEVCVVFAALRCQPQGAGRACMTSSTEPVKFELRKSIIRGVAAHGGRTDGPPAQVPTDPTEHGNNPGGCANRHSYRAHTRTHTSQTS